MRPVNHIMMLLHYSYLQLSNGFEIFIMQIPKAYKPPAVLAFQNVTSMCAPFKILTFKHFSHPGVTIAVDKLRTNHTI